MSGGFFEDTMDYITSGYGPVLEEDFPYSSQYTVNDYDKLLDVSPLAYVGSYIDFPAIKKEEEERTDEEDVQLIRKQIKQHIMENGSVAATITTPQRFIDGYNMDTSSMYTPAYLSGYEEYGEFVNFNDNRHLVSIIGWDDNYSRENFNEKYRPENDGAYIILNSWGKEFGQGGIFYISYEDKYIERELSGITEASTNKNDLNSLIKLNFEDRNLYKKLKEALGKKIISYDDSNMELTLTDAAINSVETIDLSNSEINNISGIDKFKNVRNINLSNNNITDFSPIYSLNQLQELYLQNCGVTNLSDIFPQEYLDKFEDGKIMDIIDLSENQISNIGVLSNFAQIRDLRMANTGLTNQKLEELNTVKVNKLDISSNTALTSVEALNALVDPNDNGDSWFKKSLWNLNVSNNKNIDLNTIPEHLDELYLANMGLTNEDLTKINFENLNVLSLAHNPEISSFDNINDKSTIYELDLSGDTQVVIESIVHEFPRINKLIYRDSNVTSIMPFLAYKQIENDIGNKVNVGIQVLDLSNNSINLAENDFEQWMAIVDSMWIYEINLSNNKTTDMMRYINEDHYFTMDLSYNNMYPEFDPPRYISGMEGQNYVSDLYIDTERINDFQSIGQNLVCINNTKYSNGYGDILEITGADFDAVTGSFIITSNPGEQTTVKIKRGKLENSTITYNIKSKDDVNLVSIFVAKMPDKRKFIEGEQFDVTGMVIRGIYDNNSFSDIDDYEIENGESLRPDQGSILIKKDGSECSINVINGNEEYIDLSWNDDSVVVYEEDQVTTISFTEKDIYESICNTLENIISKDDENYSIVLPKNQLEEEYQIVITGDDVENLDEIEDLFPMLSIVKLYGKNISDISSLKNNGIYSLVIENNEKLENLDVFKDSETLESIILKNTKINDLNNLKSLKNLTVDSNTIPTFDQIKSNFNSMYITQRLNLSELDYDENNIYTLPDFMQEALNGELPENIQNQIVDTKVNAKTNYVIRDEIYAKSITEKDINLINDNGVWKLDLTDFIEDDSIKNRFIKVTADIRDNWDSISNFTLIINNDEAIIVDHLEIDGQIPLTFEEGKNISLSDINVYKVYSNGEKEIITEYTINEEIATEGLESIKLGYSEDGNTYELNVPVVVKKHEHEWGEWTITKYPTESEDGEMERVCLKDNTHKETKTIEKTTNKDQDDERSDKSTTDSSTPDTIKHNDSNMDLKQENDEGVNNKKSPKAGDNIELFVICGIVCLLILGTFSKIIKKSSNKQK